MPYEFSSAFGGGAQASRTEDKRTILSVSELNEYIRMLLESNPVLKNVWVKGEISNFTNHRSGHLYFSLKDENGVIRAVMFRTNASTLPFSPEEGMKVLLHGRVTLYGKTGQYQINADSMQPDGIGALYIAFEQLKRRLEAEGLFDAERKKTLPRYPKRIGIITSPTGAAIRDMMQITNRRFPLTELVLYPSLVQGSGAPSQLCAGIRYFETEQEEQTKNSVDLIIIGRGGGSIEDLWAFNDETLARTIAASSIPIISAVGHETDFTICDFAADCRAPTPSAAAELAVPDASVLLRQLSNLGRHFETNLLGLIEHNRIRIRTVETSRGLLKPSYTVDEKRMELDRLTDRFDGAFRRDADMKKRELRRVAERLQALNPLGVLSRGYCMVNREDGTIASQAAELSEGDAVTIRFADGERPAVIQAPAFGAVKTFEACENSN